MGIKPGVHEVRGGRIAKEPMKHAHFDGSIAELAELEEIRTLSTPLTHLTPLTPLTPFLTPLTTPLTPLTYIMLRRPYWDRYTTIG